MQSTGNSVIVRCPNCDWRILDKVTPTWGEITVKCPNCRRVVQLDLSLWRVFRRRMIYRRYM